MTGLGVLNSSLSMASKRPRVEVSVGECGAKRAPTEDEAKAVIEEALQGLTGDQRSEAIQSFKKAADKLDAELVSLADTKSFIDRGTRMGKTDELKALAKHLQHPHLEFTKVSYHCSIEHSFELNVTAYLNAKGVQAPADGRKVLDFHLSWEGDDEGQGDGSFSCGGAFSGDDLVKTKDYAYEFDYDRIKEIRKLLLLKETSSMQLLEWLSCLHGFDSFPDVGDEYKDMQDTGGSNREKSTTLATRH